VGLELLVRFEKLLLTEGPHWYVWSETRLASVWTLWDGPRVSVYSIKQVFLAHFYTVTTVTKTDTDTFTRFLLINAGSRTDF